VAPAAMDAVVGVTEIETNVAGVTVSVTPGEVIAPCVAVIVVVPAATPVAMPEELIVAAGVLDEFHVTLFVRFCVVWLLNVPVAVKDWVFPAAMDATVGVTEIETNVAGVTVSVAPGEVIAPCVAVIVAMPAATPVAMPEELIVAVAMLDEFQVTLFVTFCVV
jgi:hypothetical protein